jgi:hypothetical protein
MDKPTENQMKFVEMLQTFTDAEPKAKLKNKS